MRFGLDPAEQRRIDPMAGDTEKPELTTRRVDLAGDIIRRRIAVKQRADVDQGKFAGLPVSKVSKMFGFSRVSYYQIQHSYDQQGLAGLMPHQRGPRHAHKLTEDVMAFVLARKSKDASLQAIDLANQIKQRFGLSVHPRSIERALQRQQKKGR